VIEQNTGAGEQTIGLAVIRDLPVGGGLGYCVRTTGVKRGVFIGESTAGISEAFTGAGVVQPYWEVGEANCLQKIKPKFQPAK
jgi:hypothetical protein